MLTFKNPLGVRTLSNAEADRLDALDPGARPKVCITCKGAGSFQWWENPYERTEVANYTCDCDEQRVLYRYMLNAGVEMSLQRLGWADMTWASDEAINVVAHWSDHRAAYLDHGYGMILYGDKGTGKTALAALALKKALGDGVDGYFTSFVAMLDQAQEGWRSPEERKWYQRRVRNSQLLVIDDPGREMEGRTSAIQAFDEVIRARVAACRPTIITTNHDIPSFTVRYGGNVMSLLQERSTTHGFSGEDARASKKVSDRLKVEVEMGLTRPLVIE